jgi:aminomethyltransferase
LAITPPQLTEKTIGLLTKMKFIEKVVITDVSKERGLLFLIGPQAETVLGGSLPSEALLSWKDENLQLPWFCVSGPREKIAKTAASLADKTVPLSDTAVRLVGMQSGFPEYGKDLDEGSILLETSVPVAHQRSKGCYPGQEVIERISTYGKGRAPRRLCAFSLPGEMSFAKGTNILLKDGMKAGYVTSTLYNPLDDVTQVLASLETKHAEQVLADVGQCQFLSPEE